MLKKQEIIAVYQKGPQAIYDLVHHLENQIQDLKGCIEELENRSKIVINDLIVQQMASWATRSILLV
ncbi:hypothetical protein BK708_37175 [Bacillus thuringiensis serovar yunnanensis]|nr:hypothetical protein BK708_37175 [Bacillus thuringiensis serovar yunnanensis]